MAVKKNISHDHLQSSTRLNLCFCVNTNWKPTTHCILCYCTRTAQRATEQQQLLASLTRGGFRIESIFSAHHKTWQDTTERAEVPQSRTGTGHTGWNHTEPLQASSLCLLSVVPNVYSDILKGQRKQRHPAVAVTTLKPVYTKHRREENKKSGIVHPTSKARHTSYNFYSNVIVHDHDWLCGVTTEQAESKHTFRTEQRNSP